MTTFDIADACLELEIDLELDDLEIVFPGGAILSVSAPFDVAVAVDYSKQLMGSINAALMPLQPLFNVIDLLLVIVDFAQAVPDTLGPPPDPTALLKIIPKLKQKLDKLLAMIPPLSIPKFIKSLLKAVIVLLKGFRAQLQAVATLNLRIDAANARKAELQTLADQGKISLGVVLALEASIDCSGATAQAMLSGIAQGARPMESMLRLVGSFAGLVGLPEIPPMVSLTGSVTVAIDALDVLITLLSNVRLAIVI